MKIVLILAVAVSLAFTHENLDEPEGYVETFSPAVRQACLLTYVTAVTSAEMCDAPRAFADTAAIRYNCPRGANFVDHINAAYIRSCKETK